ncbi:hypothetical protein IAS59_003508 [Cryptococcus gattii]
MIDTGWLKENRRPTAIKLRLQSSSWALRINNRQTQCTDLVTYPLDSDDRLRKDIPNTMSKDCQLNILPGSIYSEFLLKPSYFLLLS